MAQPLVKKDDDRDEEGRLRNPKIPVFATVFDHSFNFIARSMLSAHHLLFKLIPDDFSA